MYLIHQTKPMESNQIFSTKENLLNRILFLEEDKEEYNVEYKVYALVDITPSLLTGLNSLKDSIE